MSQMFLAWAGVILGVSFIATPVKFRAKSLSLPVALDVGRTTFHFLIKLEWMFAIFTTFALILFDPTNSIWPYVSFGLYFSIVVFQSVFLLRLLDIRVTSIIKGTPVPPSRLHHLYAILEILKILLLITSGLIL